jgi:hypothetical protein
MTTHRLTLPCLQKTIWLSPPALFFCFLTADKTERSPFWHNWGDQGRIASSAEHPRRTRLPRCI